MQCTAIQPLTSCRTASYEWRGTQHQTGYLWRGRSLMATFFSPELRLAAACAMWPPSDRRTGAIHAAASGPLDWARFLRVATRHQLVGLIHEGLTQVRPEVPLEIAV